MPASLDELHAVGKQAFADREARELLPFEHQYFVAAARQQCSGNRAQQARHQ